MKTKINVISENEHPNIEINEKKALDTAKKLLRYYLTDAEIFDKSCLKEFDYKTISFDILYTTSEKTHKINVEYRKKDYEADIITFAIFADSEDKFIFDGEINLGEIIISLDKVCENAKSKNSTNEHELYFLISHGLMHLLGFDHQTMIEYNFIIASQEKALNSLKSGVK
jgi:probable rRNA maturation factor